MEWGPREDENQGSASGNRPSWFQEELCLVTHTSTVTRTSGLNGCAAMAWLPGTTSIHFQTMHTLPIGGCSRAKMCSETCPTLGSLCHELAQGGLGHTAEGHRDSSPFLLPMEGWSHSHQEARTVSHPGADTAALEFHGSRLNSAHNPPISTLLSLEPGGSHIPSRQRQKEGAKSGAVDVNRGPTWLLCVPREPCQASSAPAPNS